MCVCVTVCVVVCVLCVIENEQHHLSVKSGNKLAHLNERSEGCRGTKVNPIFCMASPILRGVDVHVCFGGGDVR